LISHASLIMSTVHGPPAPASIAPNKVDLRAPLDEEGAASLLQAYHGDPFAFRHAPVLRLPPACAWAALTLFDFSSTLRSPSGG
jgi:hypothetical protein